MTLFIICIPLMLVAVAIAAVPLIAVSRSEMRGIAAELKREVEQHRPAHHAHQALRPHTHDNRGAGALVSTPNGIDGQPSHVPALVGEV